MKQVVYRLPIALCAGVLVSCGAGGGAGSDLEPDLGEANMETPVDETPSTPTTPDVTEEISEPPAPATLPTAELQADATFDFSTSWNMNIDFTLPLQDTYLSLCTDYTTSSTAQPTVNFESCIVRAPVSGGLYQATDIAMTNEITSLIGVLIDYANPEQPMYVEFSITTGQESLAWEQGVTL